MKRLVLNTVYQQFHMQEFILDYTSVSEIEKAHLVNVVGLLHLLLLLV